jgi:hypothetical protein
VVGVWVDVWVGVFVADFEAVFVGWVLGSGRGTVAYRTVSDEAAGRVIFVTGSMETRMP